MTETRACWCCGFEGDQSSTVFGPPGLAMCFRCIPIYDPKADLAFSGTCTFCGDRIGAPRGRLSDAPVRAAAVCGAAAMCGECLKLMHDILEENLG